MPQHWQLLIAQRPEKEVLPWQFKLIVRQGSATAKGSIKPQGLHAHAGHTWAARINCNGALNRELHSSLEQKLRCCVPPLFLGKVLPAGLSPVHLLGASARTTSGAISPHKCTPLQIKRWRHLDFPLTPGTLLPPYCQDSAVCIHMGRL